MRRVLFGRTARNVVRATVIACALLGMARSASPQENAAPATAAEAAKILDLVKIPPAPKSDPTARRRTAELAYSTETPVKEAYEFHRKQLLDAGWKEAPSAYVTNESASNSFSREGYTVSLMVFPDGQGKKSNVAIRHHGNLDYARLPVPPGAKPLYQGPAAAMFVVDLPVAEAVEFTRSALAKLGWQPYGDGGPTRFYKRNAVRLSAMISSAPAQGGKTVVQYGSELMSVELPAFPNAENVQYSDSTTALHLDTKAPQDEVFAFYRKALAASGWKATTDAPFKSGVKYETIFRNPAKDMITVQVGVYEGKSQTNVKHETAAEVAEAEKRFEAKLAERKKADRKREEMRKATIAKKAARSKVAVPIPADATGVKVRESGIQFKPAAGKTREGVDAIREALGKLGWTEDVKTLEAMAGVVVFKKDGNVITLTYSDTGGFLPSEINLSGVGAKLERAEGSK